MKQKYENNVDYPNSDAGDEMSHSLKINIINILKTWLF